MSIGIFFFQDIVLRSESVTRPVIDSIMLSAARVRVSEQFAKYRIDRYTVQISDVVVIRQVSGTPESVLLVGADHLDCICRIHFPNCDEIYFKDESIYTDDELYAGAPLEGRKKARKPNVPQPPWSELPEETAQMVRAEIAKARILGPQRRRLTGAGYSPEGL